MTNTGLNVTVGHGRITVKVSIRKIPETAPSPWGMWTPIPYINAWVHPTPNDSLTGSCTSTQLRNKVTIGYNGMPQTTPSSLTITTPSNSHTPRPTPLTTPNDIRIHSAVLPQTTHWTDRQTDRPTDIPREGLGKWLVKILRMSAILTESNALIMDMQMRFYSLICNSMWWVWWVVSKLADKSIHAGDWQMIVLVVGPRMRNYILLTMFEFNAIKPKCS